MTQASCNRAYLHKLHPRTSALQVHTSKAAAAAAAKEVNAGSRLRPSRCNDNPAGMRDEEEEGLDEEGDDSVER